mgnify:CR=1 FL=1
MKKLRYAFIIIVGLLLYSLLLMVSVRNIYISVDFGEKKLGPLAAPLKFMAELPAALLAAFRPEEWFVANTRSKDGFAYVNKSHENTYPKLLVSYKTEGSYENKFDLLDINTGALIKRWFPDNEMLYQQAFNPENYRKPPSKSSDLYFNHPILTKDSSLVFVAPLTSLIAKIDRNSELVWMKNDKRYHHSLEQGADGNIYSCSQTFQSGAYDIFPGEHSFYKNKVYDDHVTVFDPDTGEELFNKSVIQILLENGYEDLLLQKGQIINDPIHLNDVEPARYTTEYWNKGDLLLSCRNIGAVILYRPSTNAIIWLKQGPWYNQHDADFYEEDKIVIYGNDIVRDESRPGHRLSGLYDSFNHSRTHNDVYVYNFSNDSISKPYHQLMEDENVRTVGEGRCDILPNGDLFVEETESGRIIIGDSTAKKIEFVKRIDEEHVAYLFWSRIIN